MTITSSGSTGSATSPTPSGSPTGVGELAEAEGHHPDLLVAWGRVRVTLIHSCRRRPHEQRLHSGRENRARPSTDACLSLIRRARARTVRPSRRFRPAGVIGELDLPERDGDLEAQPALHLVARLEPRRVEDRLAASEREVVGASLGVAQAGIERIDRQHPRARVLDGHRNAEFDVARSRKKVGLRDAAANASYREPVGSGIRGLSQSVRHRLLGPRRAGFDGRRCRGAGLSGERHAPDPATAARQHAVSTGPCRRPARAPSIPWIGPRSAWAGKQRREEATAEPGGQRGELEVVLGGGAE